MAPLPDLIGRSFNDLNVAAGRRRRCAAVAPGRFRVRAARIRPGPAHPLGHPARWSSRASPPCPMVHSGTWERVWGVWRRSRGPGPIARSWLSSGRSHGLNSSSASAPGSPRRTSASSRARPPRPSTGRNSRRASSSAVRGKARRDPGPDRQPPRARRDVRRPLSWASITLPGAHAQSGGMAV